MAYDESVNNMDELQHDTEDCSDMTRLEPGIVEKERNSFTRRCRSFIHVQGSYHFFTLRIVLYLNVFFLRFTDTLYFENEDLSNIFSNFEEYYYYLLYFIIFII